MKQIFLLAGEASGDLQGALLARALLARRPDLKLTGVGGAKMEAAGVELILRSEELAVVGLIEVAGRARQILRAFSHVRRFLRESRPDLFVPIDFPDFNFRLLPLARKLAIPVAYYISPQVWAWRSGRVRTLRRYVNRMIVIFPFEESFYRKHHLEVTWVGHPLTAIIEPAAEPAQERAARGLDPAGPAVALLPGSRSGELRRHVPLLAETRTRVDAERARLRLPPVRWLLGRAPGVRGRLLSDLDFAADHELTGVEALRCADLGLVASGTVTLEATLLGRPVIVVYRMNPVTYALIRRWVKVEHIAMANLLAGRRVVPELIQGAATPAALAAETLRLLADAPARAAMRNALLSARATLGPPGAADRAAQAVLGVLEDA